MQNYETFLTEHITTLLGDKKCNSLMFCKGVTLQNIKHPDKISINIEKADALSMDMLTYTFILYPDNTVEVFSTWYRELISATEYFVDNQSKPVFLGKYEVFYKPVDVELMKQIALKLEAILYDFSDEQERNESDLTKQPRGLY